MISDENAYQSQPSIREVITESNFVLGHSNALEAIESEEESQETVFDANLRSANHESDFKDSKSPISYGIESV